MRTFFIWVFGLLGSGFLGLMLGAISDHSSGLGGGFGFFGGLTVFVCARLWLAAPQRPPG
jgi:hypothetical protein